MVIDEVTSKAVSLCEGSNAGRVSREGGIDDVDIGVSADRTRTCSPHVRESRVTSRRSTMAINVTSSTYYYLPTYLVCVCSV